MGLFTRILRALSPRARRESRRLQRRLDEAKALRDAPRTRALQRELAAQIGHIPGVRIPGVTPEEAKSLHTQALQGWTEWYKMNSSNVDRLRYLPSAQLCQCVFKNGRLYQYSGVEPEIFQGWLQTHSPGGYQWYVIRAYGYAYTELATGLPVSSPRADRFAGEPFAVPQHIEDFQKSRGRQSVDRVPTAQGVAQPPTDAWKQFRR